MANECGLNDAPSGPINNLEWSSIIPAAGRGSRLNYNAPKALFPLLGRPMLSWIFDAIIPLVSHCVVVVSPEGEEAIQAVFPENENISSIIQPEPNGMADAINIALTKIETTHSIVIWGDQVSISQNTLYRCMKIHESRTNALITVPYWITNEPYIHIKTGGQENRIIEVQQKREEEIVVDRGRNDCGVFLFNTAFLRNTLKEKSNQALATGKQTGEFNLLPLLPIFDQGGKTASLVLVEDANEVMGVNTREDASKMETILRARNNTKYETNIL